MTHQVSENYYTVSKLLSNILDNVGYSREDRDRKIRICTENEVLSNMIVVLNKSRFRTYKVGSRGEGSTGPGLQSDTDSLHERYDDVVVTDLIDCQPDKTNYLMVTDDFTHPGYVKLQSICILPDNTPLPIYNVETVDTILTLDTLNRTVLSSTVHHRVSPVSGPAGHFPSHIKEFSFDIVSAPRCSKWPREGYEWFRRRRLFGWPQQQDIEKARKDGCFATPVGHPHSSEQHQEWRLSFSITERNLVRSFENTVMKVYVLLKIIKKTYIEPVVGDAFSSYHCKVCMLWMREGTSRDLWRDENLLYCLILCIRQLYEWATAGFCPDYFIVTNNVYDRNLIGEKQLNLVQILEYLLSTNCRFLLGIECCCLGQSLANAMCGVVHCHMLSIAAIVQDVQLDYTSIINLVCFARQIMLLYIVQYCPTLVDYLERLMYASKHLPYIMQYPLHYIMSFLWSQLGFHIASVCRSNAHTLSSDKLDYLLALASGCLSIGINSDATSVRLKLCGLGIELGNSDLSEVCLQHISDYRMRYMFSVTAGCEVALECSRRSIVENTLVKRYRTEELMQTHVSFSVVYMPSEISITPKPLRMEMFRSLGAPPELRIDFKHSWYDWSMVDSVICLYFFQYMNFSRLEKERQKQVAIENMINVIRAMQKRTHRDTALNLLGYCFMQEIQLTDAFACFTQSLKIRPYHNAAKFYLGLIYRKAHVMHTSYGIRTTKVAR